MARVHRNLLTYQIHFTQNVAASASKINNQILSSGLPSYKEQSSIVIKTVLLLPVLRRGWEELTIGFSVVVLCGGHVGFLTRSSVGHKAQGTRLGRIKL
jgi:hypothetical protein